IRCPRPAIISTWGGYWRDVGASAVGRPGSVGRSRTTVWEELSTDRPAHRLPPHESSVWRSVVVVAGVDHGDTVRRGLSHGVSRWGRPVGGCGTTRVQDADDVYGAVRAPVPRPQRGPAVSTVVPSPVHRVWGSVDGVRTCVHPGSARAEHPGA